VELREEGHKAYSIREGHPALPPFLTGPEVSR
jgi:hypothetical protein